MMVLLHDLLAVLTWPFKLAYWSVVLFVKALVWMAKGTLNLIAAVGLPALRFLAFVFILVATIALVADLTPMLDGFGPFEPTQFVDHWRALAPKSVTSAQQAVSNASHPLVWDVLIAPIVNLPTFLLFGLIGLGATFAGRRREAVNVYIN